MARHPRSRPGTRRLVCRDLCQPLFGDVAEARAEPRRPGAKPAPKDRSRRSACLRCPRRGTGVTRIGGRRAEARAVALAEKPLPKPGPSGCPTRPAGPVCRGDRKNLPRQGTCRFRQPRRQDCRPCRRAADRRCRPRRGKRSGACIDFQRNRIPSPASPRKSRATRCMLPSPVSA